MRTFGRDLRLAWRALWHSPGLAGVAVVTLALGIGATTAAWNATALLKNQLDGIAASDLASYLAAMAVLALAALAACWLPAWRASIGSPLDVLRSECSTRLPGGLWRAGLPFLRPGAVSAP